MSVKLAPWTAKNGKSGHSYVEGSDKRADALVDACRAAYKVKAAADKALADYIATDAKLAAGSVAISFNNWGGINVFPAKTREAGKVSTVHTVDAAAALAA